MRRVFLSARLGVVLGVWALCAALSPLEASAERGRELNATEQEQLRTGQLVARPVHERRRGLDLMGGTSWQVVNAEPEMVWRALLDTSRYHRMMPQVLEAKLVDDRSGVRTVFLRQGAGFIETSYYLTIKVHPSRREIAFSMDQDRPHGIKAAWGFYNVRPYGKGRSLLSYGVMADIGSGLVTGLVRGTVHEWMLKAPWMVKRFVEGSGRWLYR